MARWAIANMNRGGLDGKRILPASTYDLMWKPVPGRPVGISWFISEYHQMTRIGHGGSDTGFLTNIVMIPEKKAAAIAMTNCDWMGVGALTNAALDIALGFEPKPLDQKRSMANAVVEAYRKGGIDGALTQYKTLKQLKPGAYDLSEKQLNDVGKHMLREDHPADAVRVFQLNLEIYPASAAAQEGLREAESAAAAKKQKN
jgi:hypothetical protein